MKLSEQQQIFARNVGKLIDFIYAQGYACTLGEAWRTPEQAAIYQKLGKGILHSLHIDRLAIDLNLFSPDGKFLTDAASYQPFAAYWETLHPLNKSGVNFRDALGNPRPDADHFEMGKE